MTQVSDAALAIAADKAGIVGSISCPGRDFIWAENEIKKFIKERKHCNFVLAIAKLANTDRPHVLLIKKYRPKYVVFLTTHEENPEKLKKSISWVREYGGKVIFRISNIDLINKKILPDYYTLKGHDSAGRHHSSLTTTQMAEMFKERFPGIDFICTGGLYTREDVEKCFDIGASAVEIGTPFATSKESSIDEKTKLSMLNNSKHLIHTIKNRIERIHSPNNVYDLQEGVKNINKGHVFIGKRANELPKTLRSVEEIAKVLLPNP